jgi:pilus assembly protein Flp/PilA
MSMKTLFQKLTALKADRRAVTALEYGLIAALIAAVIVGAVSSLGTDISTKFTNLASDINGTTPASSGK